MYVSKRKSDPKPTRERIRSRVPPRNPVVFGPPKRCKWIEAADWPELLARGEEIYCNVPSVDDSSYCRPHLLRCYIIRQRRC